MRHFDIKKPTLCSNLGPIFSGSCTQFPTVIKHTYFSVFEKVGFVHLSLMRLSNNLLSNNNTHTFIVLQLRFLSIKDFSSMPSDYMARVRRKQVPDTTIKSDGLGKKNGGQNPKTLENYQLSNTNTHTIRYGTLIYLAAKLLLQNYENC